jgi:hypothetical protein
MIEWSSERVSFLSLEQIKVLRANALAKANDALVSLCDAELARRAPVRKKTISNSKSRSKPDEYVIGYHFVCPRERGVTLNGDGTAWTGTWVVDRALAERSALHGAYAALHTAKSESSYLQGKIKDWRRAKRDREYADGRPAKIPYGVDFLLELTEQHHDWQGDSTGERGYLWGPIPK